MRSLPQRAARHTAIESALCVQRPWSKSRNRASKDFVKELLPTEKTEEEVLDLNDLRIFAYVATFGSFSAASDSLNIHKSSVSRSLVRLETRLNTPLLDRTTRKVKLTPAGIALKERSVECLTCIGEAIGYVEDLSAEPRGQLTVRIESNLGLAGHLQAQLVPYFLERHREVQLLLCLSKPESLSEDVDISLFSECPPEFKYPSQKLGTIARYLCAAPEYLERRGRPLSAAMLFDHDVVMTCEVGKTGILARGIGHELLFENVTPRLTTNDPLSARQFILAGGGIGVLCAHLCRRELDSGRLVRVIPELELVPLEISATFPSKRQFAPVVKAFIELLKSAFFLENLATGVGEER